MPQGISAACRIVFFPKAEGLSERKRLGALNLRQGVRGCRGAPLHPGEGPEGAQPSPGETARRGNGAQNGGFTMYDRSMPNVSLEMRAKLTGGMPECELPAPYGIRTFRAGEEADWCRIATSAEEFDSEEEAMKRGFNGSFRPDYLLLDGRMFFVVDENDKPVGTTSAWFDGEGGMLHWVAIEAQHQGKGLARPMIAAAMKRMHEFGYEKAMLHTQPMSWVAIRLYLEFGFKPVWPKDEKTLAGWKAVYEKIGKEFCKEECADWE